MPPLPLSYDEPLRLKIIELHVWAVNEGLRGTEAAQLFDGLCQRLLDAGVPLWRAFAGMRTLHPQWGGYGYTWQRQLNTLEPRQFVRGDEYEGGILNSPIGYLIRQGEAAAGTAAAPEVRPRANLRRRLSGAEAQFDLPMLSDLAAAGATDYYADVIRFGDVGDASRGTGIGYSFATDRPSGFEDDHLSLLKAVLRSLSGRRCRAARSRRSDRARRGRENPRGPMVCRYPRLHGDRRHDSGGSGHRISRRGL
jgi:adenylate cyclase